VCVCLPILTVLPPRKGGKKTGIYVISVGINIVTNIKKRIIYIAGINEQYFLI
jgi:hypothetical protein